jgi:hypothetical protein
MTDKEVLFDSKGVLFIKKGVLIDSKRVLLNSSEFNPTAQLLTEAGKTAYASA